MEKAGPTELRPGVRADAGVVQYSSIQIVELAIRSCAPHQARDGFNNQTEIAFAGSNFVLSQFSLADIANEAGKYFVAVPRLFSKRDFCGEFLPASAHRDQFGPVPVDLAAAGGQVAPESKVVKLPHATWHEHGHGLAHQLRGVITKNLAGGRIGKLNNAVIVHADDCVVGCFNNHAMLFFAASEFFLGMPAVGDFPSELFVRRSEVRSA